MRQSVVKSINKEARKIGKSFAYPFPNRLARAAKRAYNQTPRPERKYFSVRKALTVNEKSDAK